MTGIPIAMQGPPIVSVAEYALVATISGGVAVTLIATVVVFLGWG